MSKVRAKREMTAKKMPEYWRHHEEILRIVEKKLGVRSGGRDLTAKTRSKQPVQGTRVFRTSGELLSVI